MFRWFVALVWLQGHPHLSTELDFTRSPTRQGRKGLSVWVLKTAEKRQHDNNSVSHTCRYASEFQRLYPGNRLQQPLTQARLWGVRGAPLRPLRAVNLSKQPQTPAGPGSSGPVDVHDWSICAALGTQTLWRLVLTDVLKSTSANTGG